MQAAELVHPFAPLSLKGAALLGKLGSDQMTEARSPIMPARLMLEIGGRSFFATLRLAQAPAKCSMPSLTERTRS